MRSSETRTMRLMTRGVLLALFAVAVATLALVPSGRAHADTSSDLAADTVVEQVSMLRVYNPNSGEHFYTASAAERDSLVSIGWRYEGVGWVAPSTSSTPVFRLYSGSDHHYTTSEPERDWLVSQGWTYESVGWYSDDAKTVPMLRVFNPNVEPLAMWNNSGSHHYTTDASEHGFLTSAGWRDENVGWYALEGGSAAPDWVSRLDVASKTDQIIIVEARGTRAAVSVHVKSDGQWSEVISTSDGWVGKSGIGPAREGVDYTPMGVMYPTEAFGIAADPGCPMGYLQVDGSHYWCGDSNSPLYNLMVSTRDRTDFDFSESEHIVSCGPTYDYCLNMGWNTARAPHGGAAFFLHCSQGKPTDGCVTVPRSTMVEILRLVHPGCAMVIDTPSGVSLY